MTQIYSYKSRNRSTSLAFFGWWLFPSSSKPTSDESFLCYHISGSTLLSPFSTFKGPHDDNRPTQTIQDNSLI